MPVYVIDDVACTVIHKNVESRLLSNTTYTLVLITLRLNKTS